MKQRAFLKWAGGKYRLTDKIQHHLPKRACLVEPFVGAGAVFLNTDFERYVLADINPDLINLFNIIKQDVHTYISYTKALFADENANSAEYYFKYRQQFNQSQDPFKRATLFLYLNRFGYNGLCRYNKKNEFNVPFGRYKKPYFPEQELLFFAQKAQRATFICADFHQTFQYLFDNIDEYAIYCDPPYAPLKQESNFTQYAGGGFNLTQQIELADWAKKAQQHNMPVLISNHDTEFTRHIYRDAKLKHFQVQRNIGQKSSTRIKVHELFALFSTSSFSKDSL